VGTQRPLTRIEIPRPRPGDRLGFLFGLLPAGKAVHRHRAAREAAARQARTNRDKAYRTLERLERLLAWAPDRTPECTQELEAALVFHASLLREEQRTTESDCFLLTAWEVGRLGSYPKELGTLAAALARTADTSNQAIEVYLAEIASATRSRRCSSPPAYNILRDAALGPDPLARPTAARRDLISRIAQASPSCGIALYGRALTALYDGKFESAEQLVRKARDIDVFPAQTQYIGLVARARLALARGDHTSAFDSFEEAHGCCSEHSMALAGMAEAAIAIGASEIDEEAPSPELAARIERGKAAAETMASLSPRDGSALGLLGRLCFFCGELDRAAEILTKAAEYTPSAEVLAHLALTHLRRKDVAAARRIADVAAAQHPNDAQVQCTVGDICAESADWAKAADACNRAIELRPGFVQAAIGLGRALVMQGAAARAISVLTEAAESGRRAARYWLARAQLRCGRTGEAADALAGLCRDTTRVEEYYYAASALAQESRYEEAMAMLDAAEKLAPGNASVQVQRAQVLLASGETEAAAAQLRHIEQSWPDHPYVGYGRACLAYAAGDTETAAKHLAELKQRNPDDTRLLLAESVVSLKLGDPAAAAALAEQRLAANPSDATARVILAYALAQQKRLDEAAKLLADDGGLAGSDSAMWLLGKARTEQGDYEGALACWGPLSEKHPHLQRLSLNVNRLHYLVGKAKLDKKDYAGAIDAWMMYAQQREGDADLRRSIGELWFRIGLLHLPKPEETDLRRAEHALKEAGRVLRGSPKLDLVRALLDIRMGDQPRAVQRLSRVARSGNGRSADAAALWLGLALVASDDTEAAVRILEPLHTSERRDATSKLAGHALAVAYARCGRWNEAAAIARQVMAKDGGSPNG
jgi:tetratricopeptide (TPR) repeat protein